MGRMKKEKSCSVCRGGLQGIMVEKHDGERTLLRKEEENYCPKCGRKLQ